MGRRRADLLIRRPFTAADGSRSVQREALELKVWRQGRTDPLPEGPAQLDDYLDRMELPPAPSSSSTPSPGRPGPWGPCFHVGVDNVRRARVVRRLPVLLAATSGAGAAAMLAAAGLLVFWRGHEQRFWLLMGCLGVAAVGLGVLVVHRIRTPALSNDDVFREVLGEPRADGMVPLPTELPRRRGRWRLRLVTMAVTTWVVCGFVLAMADTQAPPEIRKLKEAGAVLDTLSVASNSVRAENLGERVAPQNRIYRQDLTFDVPDGRTGSVTATLYARSVYGRGDRLPVIYVPGKPAVEAYAGVPSRDKLAADMEHYSEDVPRVFHERALSNRQLGFAVAAWLAIACSYTWLTARGGPEWPTGLRLSGSRALRGTFRSGRLQGGDTILTLRETDPPLTTVSSGLEGQHAWFCWDPREKKTREPNVKRGERPRRWHAHPAAVVFDSGHVVYGHVRFPEAQPTAGLGVAIGSEQAPLDKTRQTRVWEPRRAWPLTVSRGALTGLVLSVLISGVLFTNLVSGFFPRLLLGLVGSATLFIALALCAPGDPDGA